MNVNLTTTWVAALLLTGISSLAAEQRIEQTRRASRDVAVELELLSGSVQIVGWDREELSITGTVGDDAELEISGDDDEIDIELELEDGDWRGGHRVSVDLEIRMPRGGNLEVESLSANLEVSGLEGRIEVETMSGDVVIDGGAAAVEVETVSGSVEVRGSGTRVDASSVSGRVRLQGVAGTVEASSVNGNVEIDAEQIERGSIETVNGTVRFRGRLGRKARLSVESYSGNVILELPANTSAAIEVETFSGDIENRFGPAAERVSRHAPGQRLEFTMGSGDARVSIETFSGNVTLRP